MNNKYLFRVYKFNSNGDIVSPYLNGHELGKQKGFGRTEADYGSSEDVGNEFGNVWHNGLVIPKSTLHSGFSAIGKIDPRYSIWSDEYTLDDTDFDSEEPLEAFMKELDEKVPDFTKESQMFKSLYRGDETNDYDFLMSHKYRPSNRVKYIAQVLGQKGADDIRGYTLSPKYFDFDSDDVWDSLVEDIDIYDTFGMNPLKPFSGIREDTDDDLRVILATTPEDKLISTNEAINKGYTLQRDFPSELVTHEITPLREFSEYPEAYKNYRNARRKGATGRDAFAESFKLDPTDIVSDENKKHIYKDIVKWYGDYNTRNNLLKGIRGFGQ